MTELPLQGEGLAVERFAEIRGRHFAERLWAPTNSTHTEGSWENLCRVDRQPYPCDAAQLLAALQAEPSPETVERVDVERLARAMLKVFPEAPFYPADLIRDDAQKVATEYARLVSETVT